jgi:paraquat-inducible protein B
VNVYAFVRAPYDALVHDDTRFWDASAIDVSAGPQGVRVRLNSLQQLITGAIGFDTPLPSAPPLHTQTVGQAIAQQATGKQLTATARSAPEAAADKVFPLYDSEAIALRNHAGPRLVYTLRFDESAAGLQSGTAVQLRGVEIGNVTEAKLTYDPASGNLYEAASMSLDPSVVQLAGVAGASVADQAAAVRAGLARLVARGLRAQLITANLLTGQKVIALDIMHDAPPATLDANARTPEFPTTHGADIDGILQSLQSTLKHIDQATAGPSLGNAVKNLDTTLTHLEQITRDVQPQIKPLIASLRATADAAQNAAQSAGSTLGPDSALATQLPALLQQVSDAARSIRELADFLERHPESLLRGRHEAPP